MTRPLDPRVLAEAPIEVVGRLATASNLAVLVSLEVEGGEDKDAAHAIYKPVRGEKPLWDFPEGTLAGREAAAYLVATAGGWDCVPPTVLRDGPLGVGSVQQWIGDPYAVDTTDVVDVIPLGEEREGWVGVLSGFDETGREVEVVHEDRDDLRSLAVLDALINNSDRKGGHCVRDADGHLWAFDHGVAFHHEPKLRTVLWAWAGDPLPSHDLDRVARVLEALETHVGEALGRLLPEDDVAALRERAEQLLESGCHPEPSEDWPSVPWPAL